MRGFSLVVFCVVAGCSGQADRADPNAEAAVILAASARATGFDDAPGLVQLLAHAAVQGPDTAFRTLIHSSSDGRVRMEQRHFGLLAGVGRNGGWRVTADGVVDSLGAMINFVRGHELHMLALLPQSRLQRPRYRGTSTLQEHPTLAVAMSLPSGDSVVAHFQVGDTLPVGFVMTWTDPYVEVVVADWLELDGRRLFESAVFRQGVEEFLYRFDSLRVGPIRDDVFEPEGS